MLEILEVRFDSSQYRAIVDLRRRVLRAPLGLDFAAEQLKAEQTDIHIGCYLDGALVGCVVLTPDSSSGASKLKLRQMVVDPRHRGHNIGCEILDFAETLARSRGYNQISLHARESALGFYQKAGYAEHGDGFVEVTIPHWKMTKQLG